MERFENKLKIGLDNQGDIEVLKGHEGEIFNSVVFKSFKSTKGKETFKSSSPDRKIIILSPFSETPQAGESYRVLILEDTDPNNPMDGKMIATIVREKLGTGEVRDLAIEIRNKYEKKRTEDVLTPEDRERLASLLKKCVEYYVGSDQGYDDDRDDYDDYNDPLDTEEEKIRKEKKKAEQKIKADTVIDLRRQLRDEGSKVVSYILEYSHTPNPDKYWLYKYSELLYFAASPKDTKKVVEFFSINQIVKDEDRSTKGHIYKLMSRIGNASDVDSLKSFFDKMLQTPYRRNTVNLKSYDANEVIETLLEIKEKTTDPVDIVKINKAIEYVKTKIKQIGGGTFHTEIAGPDKLKEEYEEKFLDIELRNGIRKFTYYWENYNPDRDNDDDYYDDDDNIDKDDLVTAVNKFKNVLNKHKANDKMPVLVNKAYWTLIERGCNAPENPGIKEAISDLQILTGIEPDYHDFEKQIQDAYKERLLGDFVYQENVDFAQELYARTGVKFIVEPEIVQKKYLAIIGNNNYVDSLMPTLQELTGVEPDFSSIEPKIQEIYKNIILNTDRYEAAYYDRNRPGLKKAELLYDTTGIRPQIDPDKMQERYKKWLRSSEPIKLITVAESITGIKPDFTGMEDVIQAQYDRLIFTIRDEDLQAVDWFNSLKNLSNIEPIFDAAKIRKIYLEKAIHGSSKSIKIIEELTGIVPDYESYRERIEGIYFHYLTEFDPYNFDPTLKKVKDLQKTTGIKPDFNQAEMSRISEYAIRQFRQVGRLSQIFRLEEILASPELMARVVGEILINSIDQSDRQSFNLAREKMKALKVTFNANDAVKLVRRHLSDDPKKVVNILKFLKSEPQDDELVFLLQKTISHDPWVSAFSRLEKIQGIAANADNDPWENEFKPFIRGMLDRGVISVDREEDAELVVSFIEMMGMNNLPQIFDVYVDCQRHKDPSELSGNTIRLCLEFGIKPQRQDGTWRFKSSLELFNELSKALKGIQTDLLTDKIPDGLDTNLGQELFNRLKGSTQFERNHSVAGIIKKWNETVAKTPALAELPPGFNEATIKVPLLKQQRIETTKDQSEELDKLMASQEVADVYLPLAQSWELAANNGSVSEWFEILINRFSDEEVKIRELLAKPPEEIDKMIADESDPKSKQALVKKSKALQNPKGRQGIERQADVLKEVTQEITKIHNVLDNSGFFEGDYVAALEALNKLDGKVSLVKEIRELSALHMYNSVMGEGSQESVDTLFDSDSTASMVDKIYGLHKISKDYVEEHYLHHLQDQEHTEHTPFSPELLEKLNLVWQQQLDKKTGYLPITFLKNKLDQILGVESGKSRKETAVSIVPVSGLLHIYSGDLGDSCHTSQHDAIATGQFPNLRSWVYVTNRGKQNEELRGSVLAIQAEKTDGVPVLVVRANNPAENFIQTVDSDAFTINLLKEAVETARRSRAARIKKDPSLPTVKLRQMVTIPMDTRGAASTNRQLVNDVYRKRFIKCTKVALKDTSETNFNNYRVWDDRGYTPSVVIWEIDEDGNEKWHGDWK